MVDAQPNTDSSRPSTGEGIWAEFSMRGRVGAVTGLAMQGVP